MIRNKFFRSFLLIAAVAGLAACADSIPTSPSAPAQTQHTLLAPDKTQNGLIGDLLGGVVQTVTSVVGFVGDATGLTVHPVKWGPTHVADSYTVSGVITPWGGTLVIPQADFSISFPYGAVTQPTTITITADPNYVAYKMQPTGLRFAKPVVVTQRLQNTAVAGQPLSAQLFGAYISDDLLDLSTLLHVLEIENSLTIFRSSSGSLIPDTEIWQINHFSRYMLASG